MRTIEGRWAVGSQGRLSHGKSRSRAYSVYRSMRTRCENPNTPAYKDYGGRGIVVCDRWKTFEGFYADMGDPPEGLTLDRIDNDCGYSPDNCRWADRFTQARNKRGLRMVRVGEAEHSLGEWSEITGLKLGTIWERLNNGWSAEAAISTPKLRESRRGWKHLTSPATVQFDDEE